MEETKYQGHVVVIPYPSQGHINPLLQFAKRLVSKGIKATLATTPYTLHSISAPNISVEPISDGFDRAGYAQAQNEDVYLKSFKSNGSKGLSQLIQKYENSTCPIDCVIYDSFLPWALDVAKEHGIVGASFFTNSGAVCSIFCRIHHGMLTFPVENDNLPLVLPGVPPLNLLDLPSFLRAPESYPAYLAMKLNQYSNLEMADWVFGNTFEALEGQVVKGISELWPAKLIGPMVPSSHLDGRIKGDRGYGANLWKPLSDKCNEWLETKPCKSVAFISFGSMIKLTSEQVEEIAWGLNNSSFNFLWVVKESEISKLPYGFEESTKERGLIVTWCNQLEILAHKATGCFMTHCGWNSTLEGLSLGVPMIAVPQWADQLTDAKFIEDVWEVGVRAEEDENGIVRRDDVVWCLKEVMEGERSSKIRKNASRYRELCKEAIGEGGSSDISINEFVQHLKSLHIAHSNNAEERALN